MTRPADELLALAAEALGAGRRAAICMVLSARGSTPQPAGAAMVVVESGATAGTIGGGCVEAEARRTALAAIHSGRACTLTLRLDHDYGWDDGLICGGTMHVAVGLLDDPGAIERARADVAQGRPARVEFAADPSLGAPRHALVLPPPQRLLVAGAGHIGLALARLAIPLDFEVVVFDDRADLLARAAALGAATRPGPIADALAAEPIDPLTSCVIVTRGHRHDQSALRAVLDRGAAYVGMIGSRRKVLVIRQELARLGVPAESLARVHAPIGLDIGARTVEEIALSIAAQLVRARSLRPPPIQGRVGEGLAGSVTSPPRERRAHVEPPPPLATPIVGLVLAAGRSTRMGRLKQVLPWPAPDGPPLVAAAHDAIARVCQTVVVVVGHRAAEVLDALGPRPVHAVHVAPGLDMAESLRAGLRVAGRLFPNAAVLLQPGDHPTVSRATLDMLLAALARDPARAAIPTHRGRGGHPALIPPALAREIEDADLVGGLGAYWQAHPDARTLHPTDDPGVTLDLDVPDDYAAADAPR